jgi:hypothetical protein
MLSRFLGVNRHALRSVRPLLASQFHTAKLFSNRSVSSSSSTSPSKQPADQPNAGEKRFQKRLQAMKGLCLECVLMGSSAFATSFTVPFAFHLTHNLLLLNLLATVEWCTMYFGLSYAADRILKKRELFRTYQVQLPPRLAHFLEVKYKYGSSQKRTRVLRLMLLAALGLIANILVITFIQSFTQKRKLRAFMDGNNCLLRVSLVKCVGTLS